MNARNSTLSRPDARPAGQASGRRLHFVCPCGGDRSLIAAALTGHLFQGSVTAGWSCLTPPRIHPYTLVVLQERGVQADQAPYHGPSALDTTDHLIVLATADELPRNAGKLARVNRWAFENPAPETATSSLSEFRRLRDALEWHAWRWLTGAG